MASNDDVKHLILTGVKISDREVGRGAYGRVFEADYNGTTCAAKQIHPLLLKDVSVVEAIKQLFLRECLLHSKLDHPNIVKMLGVNYPSEGDVLQVMELMEYKLNTFLEKSQDIPMYVKLSILQDVSRGVHYLHTLNPPVIHHDLSPNNILLNNNLVVKLCDFLVAKKMPESPYSSEEMTKAPGTVDFMPPEALVDDPHYGLPLDVFSFGCVVCHVISQQWPIPSQTTVPIPNSSELRTFSEVERRQRYIDQITDESLKQLVISCLDNDPERRPPIWEDYQYDNR